MSTAPYLRSKSGKVLEKPRFYAGFELYHPGKVLPFSGQVLYHRAKYFTTLV